MIQRHLPLLFLLLAVFSNPSGVVAESAASRVWTARDAVEFALRNNPDSLVAHQRLKEAEALRLRSAASFYPHIDLSASYSQTDNPMYSFGNILNQGAFTPGIDFNAPGRTDDLNLGAGAHYRFYNGGQDLARNRAATAGVEASAAARDAVLLRLQFEVFRSFHKIDEAQNVNRAMMLALDSIRASLAVARARYAAGDLLKADLLNLEVQESRALEDQIASAHTLALANRVFLQLLGLNAGDVRIAPGPMEAPLRPASPDPQLRPELLQLQASLRAAESEVQAARGSRWPTLDGFATYNYNQGYVLDGSGDSWLAGVKVNFKAFDGQSAAADIALSEARLRALRGEQGKLELALGLEVTQAELALRQAEQRLQVTQKMVDQATESELLSRARFNEGALLAADLIEIDTRLTEARVRNAVAASALQVAIADLRRAAGLPVFETNDDSHPSVEIQP